MVDVEQLVRDCEAEVAEEAAATADQPAGRTDAGLVEVAVELVHAIRDAGARETAARILAAVPPEQMNNLCVTLAAIVPAGVDVEQALEWVDLPPDEWSRTTVAIEDSRYRRGDRDLTAHHGRLQAQRRKGKL